MTSQSSLLHFVCLPSAPVPACVSVSFFLVCGPVCLRLLHPFISHLICFIKEGLVFSAGFDSHILGAHLMSLPQLFLLRTLFTGTERYTYVDPDYALTDEEEKLKQKHKQKYLDYIEDLRQCRIAEDKSR